MKGFHPISKKKKWLIGALTPVMAVCLAMGLVFMNATEGFESPTYAAATEFNNIVNANIGMHPKWELAKCATVDQGGVGDTYTSAHKIWRVTTNETNDPIMEKSPSYVFTGNEEHADDLIKTYSLKKGNEVVFNITEEDTAAKVWADAIAFAQSIGKKTALVEDDLANCSGNSGKNSSSGDGSHNGWRVGSNVGERNHYQGNFFLENQDGALGQYITVRLQTDWVAKDITAAIPQTVKKVADNKAGDYIEISGDTKELKTTTFDYIKTTLRDENGNYLVKDTGTTNYLDKLGDKTDFNAVTNFNCISTDGAYTLSYDLASNGFDYDVSYNDTQTAGDSNAKTPKKALNVFNDICAFSFGRLHIPTGVYIVLDLNGHTIDRNLTGEGKGDYYGSVFSVSNVARLEIMDSSAYENASAARIESGVDGATYTTNHEGTITGGHIIGAEDSYTGQYQKNTAFPNDMRLRFQHMGGAVNIAPWGDFVMDSGTVKGNKVTGPENGSSRGGSGGAFYQRSKAAVTIYDGYVIDNSASNKGGVTILGDGSGCAFTMYGGVLAHNESGYLGGAVHLGTSTYANFHGGEIVNNTTGARGGAINLFGNTLGILDSVTITGNKVTQDESQDGDHKNGHGGAIYVDEATNSIDAFRTEKGLGAGFRFRGSLQIYGNKVGSSEKEENVYLSYSDKNTGDVKISGGPSTPYIEGFAKIAIGGPLIANGIVARVGVTIGGTVDTNDSSKNVFTSGYGEENGSVDTFLYFSSDDGTYSVENQGEGEAREATLVTKVQGNGGITWVIEGTGTDADTDMNKGESTLKIVIPSTGDPTFYYKNPNNQHGLTSLQKVDNNSQMNKSVKLTSGDSNKLLDVLKDRFTYSNGSLTFEYSMLKVTKISAYTGSPTFGVSGDNLTMSGGTLLRCWESTKAPSGDDAYIINNTFENANFRFKLGTDDLTATKNSVTGAMQNAISATDGSISYAGEYSVLISETGKRYANPSFKIKINQVGVEVGRTLYYNGQNIETDLKWLKDVDWDGDGNPGETGQNAALGDEKDQPYFIYSGGYYFPILNAEYNRLQVFKLYDPYTKKYTSVAKGAFTGYVLEFTYANQYFGTNQPVQFGGHSGGGIEYQTMHRQPNSTSGTGTYVPGVRNAGMYTVKFISSRSAQSAEEGNKEFEATGVYFASNNFAFSSGINIYVDPASAEVELTKQAQDGFTYNAREIGDESIVIYDNTSNTHVNPHLDDAATLEYYLFDDLKFKAGVYDKRTKLYYTLDQVKTDTEWQKVRPYGRKEKNGQEDEDWATEAKKKGKYFPSYMDSELQKPPVVKWADKTEFDPSSTSNNILTGILPAEGLKAFQALYEKTVDAESTGKLVYIVDESSFSGGTSKLGSNPTDARRYVVFVTLDLDAGYDDYNYVFDQDAEHLVGLDGDTPYFWAFEFTVNPAVVRPYDFDTTDSVPAIPGEGDRNTSVTVQREVVFNGLGQFQLPTLTFTDSLGVQRLLTGSAAKFNDGGTTFETGLYSGATFTVLENGYDYVVKYYIKEYELKDDDGKYLDYVNVMGEKKLKVRIYIPAYKDEKGNLTGATGNYVFDGTALGNSMKDDEGYYYEIKYEITPVTVTTSLTVTYTYDGTTREEEYQPSLYTQDNTKYPEQGGKVGEGVGGVYTTWRPGLASNRQRGFIYPFSMVKDSTWDATEGKSVGPAVGDGANGKKTLKYTLSNPTYVFSNTDYQKNTDITFGCGVYTFETGSANVGTYALSTATTLKDGTGIKTQRNERKLDINAGVVWVFGFSNTKDTDTPYTRQGLNGTADEKGNYGNFVVGEGSYITVIIEAKNIADENVFATKIQQHKKEASLTTFETDHGALNSDADGYADVAYKTNDSGAVVQDTAADTDGMYKMATFPFAGTSTFYRPHVKMSYYKYGINGANKESARSIDLVQDMAEGTDFTLKWADNNVVSMASDAEKISGEDTEGQFPSVIIEAKGNYTGSVTVNFHIRPAIIAIKHNGAAYDYAISAPGRYNCYYFDRSSHAIQLTYTNREDYTPYEGMLCTARGTALDAEQVSELKTKNNIDISSVAYAYASKELFDAFYNKYFNDGSVDSKELEELNKLYSTVAPVDADVYYVAIALSNENFVFEKQTNEGDFPSITGSNFGNGTNDLVRGTFEIKPATVAATLQGANSEFYNRLSHTASFNFTNARQQDAGVVPSTLLNEYTVTYQCGSGTEHNSTEGMVDAGTYTVTLKVGAHAWFSEENITADMKSGVTIPTPSCSNFVFSTTGEGTRTFNFTIKPAEIKLDKFADTIYNKAGQGVTLVFTNIERNNEAVPTLAAADASDDVTADEYTITYTPDLTTTNAKLTDGSSLPLNAGKYTVVVALTDAAKSKEDTSQYNFKFIRGSTGSDQTVDTSGTTISSSYTIAPATVTAFLTESESSNTEMTDFSIDFDSADHKAGVGFTSNTDAIPNATNSEECTLEYNYIGWKDNWKQNTDGFINAGQYTVNIELKKDGNYCFSRTTSGGYSYTQKLSYNINYHRLTKEDLVFVEKNGTPIYGLKSDDDSIIVGKNGDGVVDIVYTGDMIEPIEGLTVTGSNNASHTLKPNEDYVITYIGNINAGNCRVIVNGMQNFIGTLSLSFTISPKSLGSSTDQVDGYSIDRNGAYILCEKMANYVYNGSPQSIAVNMTYSPTQEKTNTLVAGSDYKIIKAYLNGEAKDPTTGIKEVGKYTVLIQGQGTNYEGIFVLEVTVLPEGITAIAETESFTYDGNPHISGVIFIAGSGTAVPQPVDWKSATDLFNKDDDKWVYKNEEYTLTVSSTKGSGYDGVFNDGNDFRNAGTYTVTVEFLKNFEFANPNNEENKKVMTYTFKINPDVITINEFESKTYNGKPQGVTVDSNTFASLSVSVLSGDLLELLKTNGFSAESSITYDGLSGTTKPTNAGRYTVTVQLEKGGNFAFGRTSATDYVYSTTSTFTISPFDIRKIDDQYIKIADCTYTGVALTPDVTVTFELGGESRTLQLTKEFTVSYIDNVNASSEAQAVLVGVGNFTGTKTKNFTINKKSIGGGKTKDDEITVNGSETMEYNGKAYLPNLTIRYSPKSVEPSPINVLVLDAANGDYTISYFKNGGTALDGAPKDAGLYYILVTANGGNYTGSFEINFTITPTTLTLALNGSAAYIYTGTSYTPGVLVLSTSGATPESGKDYTVEATTYQNDNKMAGADHGNCTNAGTYTITVTITSSNNYVFAGNKTTASITYRILPARLEVSLSESSAAYSGVGHDLTGKIVFTNKDGVVTPSASEYSIGYAVKDGKGELGGDLPLTLGTYNVTVQLKVGGNFIFDATGYDPTKPDTYVASEYDFAKTLDYTIEQMATTVTLENLSLIYNKEEQKQKPVFGTDVVTEADYEVKYEYSPLDQDTITEASNFVNAGKYKVTVALKNREGYDQPFFKLVNGENDTSWTATYTINQAKVRVELKNSSATYNGNSFDLHSDTYFSFTNLNGNTGVLPEVSDDEYNGFTVTYKSGSHGTDQPRHAGDYTVTVTLGDNFTPENNAVSFTFTVEPKTVSVGLYEPGDENKPQAQWSQKESMSYDGAAHDMVDLVSILFTGTVDGAPLGIYRGQAAADDIRSYSVQYNGLTFNDKFAAAGTYTITVKLAQGGNFSFGSDGSPIYEKALTFTIVQLDIEPNDVGLSLVITGLDHYYTGSPITLDEREVTVYLVHRHLVDGEWVDYTNEDALRDDLKPVKLTADQYFLMYAGNVNAGEAQVTVIGQGGIKGQDQATFTILPKPLGTHQGTGDSWEMGNEFAIENLGTLLAQAGVNVFYYNGSGVSLTPSVMYTPTSLSKFALQTSDYTLSWKAKDGNEWTSVTTSTPTDAGEYILRVKAAENGNYADEFDVNFRILPALIKAELGASDNYYTGEGQNAVINFSYSSNGMAISDIGTYTVSYTGTALAGGLPINAGAYGVTVTLTDCKNFVFSYGTNGLPVENAEQKTNLSGFTIKPAVVLAGLSRTSATYTGQSIDCTPYITITPYLGGSDSEVWKQAISDFSLTYLDSGLPPVTVGEYRITVTLKNANLEFLSHDTRSGKISLPLTFNVLRANLRAKAGGEFDDGHTDQPINGKRFNLTVPDRMEGDRIIYDPARAVEFGITASKDFNLFREEDTVSINYTVRTSAAASAFEYTGSGVTFTGSGTFDIEVEVTSANYETAKFTVHVVIDTKDVVITTNGVILTTYGDSDLDSGDALLDAFLAIVTNIQGVPGEVTGLERQKEWLRTWGLGVSVVFGANDVSTAGKLKAGSYSLKLTFGLADKNACFANATSDDASVSRDVLYEVAKKDLALDWDLGDIEYDATSHYGALLYRAANGAQLSGVFHTAALDGDQVSFARYTISQYNDATGEWDTIAGATDSALRNVGRYKITVGATLDGADSDNYSFSGADRDFEITRMVVSVNVADARIVYGEDFKTVLAIAFENIAKLSEVLSREEGSSFNRTEIESFLKSLLVLQARGGGDVYDGLGDLPPVGRYDIKFGKFDGVTWDGTILNDDDIYSNYRFVLYGQYGGASYATLTVYSTNVTIILNDRDVALEIGYGEYKYSAELTGNYGEDEKLPLTARLSEYIFENILGPFGSERRVSSIVGLDEIYPGSTWAELANLITTNCWFEVVDPQISTGGYLMPGTYDLKILTKEECGFNVSFLPNYSGTLIGQSGENRLVISPKTLDIDWTTTGADVSVDGSGNVSAAYTSFAYSNRPLFTNISEGDDVGDPIFHLTDLGGVTLAEGPVNVGNYYIYVDGIAVGADNGCYVLPADLRTGLEIVPRRLTVNVHNSTSIYGEEFASLTYDVPWDWENRNDTADDLHITLRKADGKNAGSYSILGSYNNANYDLIFTEATYEITQREIEVRMDDLTSYYGERYKDFTFKQTGGSFAPGETLADLKIVGTKTGGADAGEYAINGEDVDPNYRITVLPGTYTILQAINEWYGDFSFGGWGAGDPPKDPDLPGAKFGDIEVRYYYDEECTQEIEDLSVLPEGEYFIKLTVDETRNYTGLSATYNFPVEHVIDATLYVILFVSQFVILTGALIFIRRKKSDEDKNNKQ